MRMPVYDVIRQAPTHRDVGIAITYIRLIRFTCRKHTRKKYMQIKTWKECSHARMKTKHSRTGKIKRDDDDDDDTHEK